MLRTVDVVRCRSQISFHPLRHSVAQNLVAQLQGKDALVLFRWTHRCLVLNLSVGPLKRGIALCLPSAPPTCSIAVPRDARSTHGTSNHSYCHYHRRQQQQQQQQQQTSNMNSTSTNSTMSSIMSSSKRKRTRHGTHCDQNLGK